MKVAITTAQPSLDAEVEPRFGRTPYFLIVDTETMEYEPIENPNISAGGGAGIQSAQMIVQQGVEVVITGNCGPNAFRVFGAAGIEVISGVSGPIRQVVEQFQAGTLSAAPSPSVQSHFGMGGGATPGMGMGRGMRRSGGTPTPPAYGTGKNGQDISSLKDRAKNLQKELEELQKHISKLEKE